MKRKFISTVIAAFTFIAMMSVTALASPVATIRLEAGEFEAGGQVEVGVYVDAVAPGISALVIDLGYTTGATGVQRLEPVQRQFTTSDGTNVLPQPVSVTSGIEMGPAFGMTFDQFVSPPAAPAPLRLFFEMEDDGVLTTTGRAATVTFDVPAGFEGATFTPVIRTEGGHAFAYRWLPNGEYAHITAAELAVVPLTIGIVTPTRLCGDVNGDGVVDGRDVTRMLLFDLGQTHLEFIHENADVTGDGVFDGRDTTRLLLWDLGQHHLIICHC